jgi:hypothetical protein
MLTRKDFVAIAGIVSSIKDEDVRNAVALDFVRYGQSDNPRFNPKRFLEACKSPNN